MAPRGEMREKQRNDSSSGAEEELQHYDSIDLDSCDFQPFLTTQSGIALNYHTSDHPEHKILMQQSIVESDHDEGAQSRSSQAMNSGASRLFSIMIRPQSPGVLEEEGRLPRRLVAFMRAIAVTGLLALWHVMNATRFLNFEAFTWQTLPIQKSQPTLITSAIPRQLQDAYRDVSDLPIEASDVPVYFEIPGGAANNTTNALSKCFGLQLQSSHKDSAAEQREVLQSSNESMQVTINIWETASRFNATPHRGRLVGLFYDPIHHLLHDYNRHTSSHQQHSTTFEQYLSTVPNNFIVRSLVNVQEGSITDNHLEMAKQLVRTKFLVGLVEQPTSSLERFQVYFNWKHESPKDCAKNLLARQATDVQKDLPEYIEARKANRFDVKLYNYVRQIFQEQAMISSR
jgi:hypothetical protein